MLLLLLAALVALAARRLKLPYTVGLVVTGGALALARLAGGEALTPALILNALLPALLFEAALSLRWRELRRNAIPVLTLAGLGVPLCALFVAGGMVLWAHWPWPSALVFGALIGATDPVSVIAAFKDSGVTGRVRVLVEAESLFNDGVAATLFVLALRWALPGSESPLGWGEAVRLGLTTMGGGVLIGAVCGGLLIALAGRTSDHLVETTLTTVAAYGSFGLAQHWGASGVLSTLTAGLLMGNIGMLGEDTPEILTQRGREVVIAFWDFAAFVANSLIFLLIGLRVGGLSPGAASLGGLLPAIVLSLAGRAAAVYGLSALLGALRSPIERPCRHVLFWGGLRGALALALALSLPCGLPWRDPIVVAAFGVVGFSVVIQGVTMPWLLRRLGFFPDAQER